MSRFTTSLAALALCLAAGAAHADEAPAQGHFDRDGIPARSSVFRSMGESSARTFGSVESALESTDKSLARMDLSIAMVKGAVPPASWDLWKARLESRSDAFAYEFSGIQARFDQVGAAFEAAFAAALERAIASLQAENPGAIEHCSAKPRGGALEALGAGGPAGGRSAPACPGADMTDEIARRWDKDAVLEAALLDVIGGDLGPLVIGHDASGAPVVYGGELDSRGWPALTGHSEPGEPLPLAGKGGASWVHPADLVVAFPELAEALDQIDALATEARATLSEAAGALPRDPVGNLQRDDATIAQVALIQERARGIREFTEASRAAVGAVVWASLDKGRKKGRKAGWAEAGLCVNPSGFGGCVGTDVTDVVGEALAADRKLVSALVALTEDLVIPDVSLAP